MRLNNQRGRCKKCRLHLHVLLLSIPSSHLADDQLSVLEVFEDLLITIKLARCNKGMHF